MASGRTKLKMGDFHSGLHWLIHDAHPHLLFYTVLVLVVLYRPPASFKALSGVSDFVTRHWGDSVGFYLLHFGVVLIALGGFYKEIASLEHLGESFVLTGVAMLKLKYVPPDNITTTSTTSVGSTVTPPVAEPPKI